MSVSRAELEAQADALLAEHAREEVCRECGADGHATGETAALQVYDREERAVFRDGLPFRLLSTEYACGSGHVWYTGEGRARGIDGEHAILFEDHLRHRRSREILAESGTVDPGIVSGLYNRAHPEGRPLSDKPGDGFYK